MECCWKKKSVRQGQKNRDEDTLEDDDDVFWYRAAPAALLVTGNVKVGCDAPIYNTEG
jgi:hypothetical protein